MIEIDIPTIDPMQHEPKVFLHMTARQIICILPSAILGILAFVLLKDVSLDFAVISVMIIVAPAIVLGWYKPFNMPFEKYAKLYIMNHYVNPQVRTFKKPGEKKTEKSDLNKVNLSQKKTGKSKAKKPEKPAVKETTAKVNTEENKK